jgi:hypothetical protein
MINEGSDQLHCKGESLSQCCVIVFKFVHRDQLHSLLFDIELLKIVIGLRPHLLNLPQGSLCLEQQELLQRVVFHFCYDITTY